MKEHAYEINLEWTGNTGAGTSGYRTYKRNYLVSGNGKAMQIPGSSDPAFLGDATRFNPEDLLVSALSACHMLWYLHLCAVNKVVVTACSDKATGLMEEAENGSGKFKEVVLNPVVTVADETMRATAATLHEEANKMCFIANSCNFKVSHNATTLVSSDQKS
ncbi:OsmC family protein [Adhaeribacter soli]|uniref:OsmC family peroxiredoxin n=1 Tax=Adhaeribacter soli TaxID=2607655 RepID=A0A5N1J2Q9_9BACT|nr:OsmC family protein [Adhaeribacter soli]KAA9338823.1 OsmC family peroxiredoxin [Adhaeribacter soli]